MLLTAGCKKDDPPSRSQLIVGTWQPSFEADDANQNRVLDAGERTPVTDSTVVSLKYEFKAGGSGSASLGNTSLSVPFSWALYDGDQKLVMTVTTPLVGTSSDTSKIHTLNGSELILEHIYSHNGELFWQGLKRK